MLEFVEAVEFHGPISSGRTKPSRVLCELADGQTVELVLKVSASCEEGGISLAMEVLGACIAAELNLPVPRPYLVRLSEDWIASIPDTERQDVARRSSGLAFGSSLVPSGFRIWSSGDRVSGPMQNTASGIFAFDVLTANPDRRSVNPNCFVRGDELRIFDHELSFSNRLLLRPLRQNPWTVGGLQEFTVEGAHIFRPHLRGREFPVDEIRAAWMRLSANRLREFHAAVPEVWAAGEACRSALAHVEDVCGNFDGCLEEIGRVLA